MEVISKNTDYKEKVYRLVSQIPKGKVTTYGSIAKKLNMSPRTVGTALHLNPYEREVPCHRVVNREGRIAPGFAFGGIGAQRKKLEREHVTFIDETHVDMKRHYISI